MRAMFAGVLALAITAVLVEVARRFAPVVGLVDSPNERKSHVGDIPLIGGIAIFCGLVIVMATYDLLEQHWPFLVSACLLVAVGIWDDVKGISPLPRLGFQAVAILIIATSGNAYISDLGNIIPAVGRIELGWMAIPFTVFAGVGVINAFNMSDGVDGLCGTLTLVALTGMGVVAATAGMQNELLLVLALSGGLVGFLIFNVRLPGRKQAKAFLGDAGSYLVGFSVLYIAIELSQGENRAMAPVTALWFCMLPLIDTIGMILRRIRRGRSPFKPDREHIHHVFLLAKFSVTSTWIGLAVVATVGMLFGLSGALGGMSQSVMLAAFLVVAVLYYVMIMRAWKVMRFLSRSINRRTGAKVDRRLVADRRKTREIFYIDGIPVERRSGLDRRQEATDRRNESGELSANVEILAHRPAAERPGKRAARLS